MRVRDVMVKNVKTVSPEATMAEAAGMMKKYKIGCLVVVEGDRVVGIITERDLAYKIIAERRSLETKVGIIMTKDLKTISSKKSIKDAAKVMAAHVIRRLPVVEEGKLVGIVSIEDIMRTEKVGADTSLFSYT
jgi:CBS domain-containing protein